MKDARVCMLGGTGFVGTHLAARLAGRGAHVKILSRSPYRHRQLAVLPTVRLVAADVRDDAVLAREVQGCDTVINLVGIINESRRSTFRGIHVELPRKLAQACRAAGVPRLLHMSALMADAGNAPSLYLRSKGEGEAALRVHAGNAVQYTVFQPSVIFGPGDHFINRFAALLRLVPGVFPLACPDTRFQPVFVGDVVEAFVRALDDPRSAGQRYTLCGPRVYTLREIVEFTAAQAGLRRKVVGLSNALSKLQATLLEFAPGKPFSRDNWRSLQVDTLCGEKSGLSSLGITPTSLEVAVPRYLGNDGHRRRLSTFRGSLRS